MMETREDPYKPQHNLAAAKELIYNGFPITDALLCSPDCSHHAPAHPEPIEGDDSESEEFVPDPGWVETVLEIKRMEDEGIIDNVEYDPFKPMYNWAPKEVVMPYAKEVAAKFRAKLDLQAERRANWPEIEERRRKKLEQIYPSHLRRRRRRTAGYINMSLYMQTLRTLPARDRLSAVVDHVRSLPHSERPDAIES